MKSKSLTACALMTVAAIAVIAYVPAQDSGRLVTVMNPVVANKMVERLPLSPRLDKLDGKTLYMVDIGWGGPHAAPGVYEEIQAWFAKNMPAVKTEVRRIKGSYNSDDQELLSEIKAKANAAMIGISG